MLLYTLSNFEGDFEKKFKQFWAWVEKPIAYKKYLVYYKLPPKYFFLPAHSLGTVKVFGQKVQS